MDVLEPPSQGPSHRVLDLRALLTESPGVWAVRPVQAVVVAVFRLWYWWRAGVKVGPYLGAVGRVWEESEVMSALPHVPPPTHDLEKSDQESGATESLRRANAWAAALETWMLNRKRPLLGPEPVLTSFGFFQTDARLQFGVIEYHRPLAAFRAVRRGHVAKVDGAAFPILVRPWIVKPAAAATAAGRSGRDEGPCWVSTRDDARGFVTASHVLRPRNPAPGASVRTATNVPHPPGVLVAASAVMDVALVEVDPSDWGGHVPTGCSGVVGYKPIRFYAGGQVVDAQIEELTGYSGGVVPRASSAGGPIAAVLFFFNAVLRPGDSGSVGYDREFAGDAAGAPERPYLLYLGEYAGSRGVLGYGVFLRQAQLAWGFEVHE